MIASLTGKIQVKSANQMIVNVGGVGYHLHISANTFYELPEVGAEVSLQVHTHLREDQLSLYGFLATEEKELFQQLIKISGIGPKVALNILSGLSHRDFIDTVQGQDLTRLTAIPGIGKKTAERILLDLKDRLKIQLGSTTATGLNGKVVFQDTLSALVNLGYSKSEAEKSLTRLPWNTHMELEAAIKQALQILTRG